jgi:hypothetical protein
MTRSISWSIQKGAGDWRTALTALRDARDGLGLLMKPAGMLQADGKTTIVDARRQQIAIMGQLTLEDIRAFPAGAEALKSVADSWGGMGRRTRQSKRALRGEA